MDKLERLYFKTAYLCLFENEVVYRQNQNFKMPENILLKAYMHDGEAVCQEAGRQKFPMKNLITHFFEGQEHRSTVIVTLLFSTLEQYGLLISEIEEAYMHYTTPISYQISSAVKTLELLKNKEDITAQLEKSLVQIKEKGYTLVPLQVYFKGSLVKVEIGLARGKKLYDKRQDLANKDARREMERAMKERNR